MRFLRAIKEAQAIGFTLAEIEEYLRVARSGPASAALRTRAAAKIDEIDARIARLRRMRDELARIVGCACESLDHCTCGAAYLARRGRAAPVRPSPLHVTNGDSAGNTLRQTALGGAVLPWQDVLHEGPVPAGPRRELLQARAAFLSACGWGSRRSILASLEDQGPAAGPGAEGRAAGGAVVRARPVRPASASGRAGAGRPGRHAGARRGGLVSRSARLPRPRRADRGRARDALAGPGARPPGHAGRGGLGLGRPAPPRPVRARRGRRGGPCPGCRSCGPRCSGCSRSCPARATACPAPNDGRCGPWRRVRPRRPPPSWPSRTWRRRRSSATRGSSARSPAWVPARTGWSRRRPATRCRRLRRSATPARSPGCRSG